MLGFNTKSLGSYQRTGSAVAMGKTNKINRVYNFCNNKSGNPYECTFGPLPRAVSCFPEAPYSLTGTILVVGGLGYIGSNFINHAYTVFPDLKFVVLDDGSATNSNINNINSDIQADTDRFTNYTGNMNNTTDVTNILTDHVVDYVMVLSAWLPWQNASYSDFVSNNINSVNDFLETCRSFSGQLKHVLFQASVISLSESGFISNSCDYNDPKTYIYPSSSYISTKTCALEIASHYNRKYKMPISVMAPAHVFGGTNQHTLDTLLSHQNRLQNNQKLIVHPYDNVNKDIWIGMPDLLDAYTLILLEGYNGKVYNLINPTQAFTYLDTMVKIIQQLKPNEDPKNWLEYTNIRSNNNPQLTSLTTRPSNLGCFTPTVELQSEINKMPL